MSGGVFVTFLYWLCCFLFMSVESELLALADPKRVSGYQRFFKTGKGEYGEGDVFIGVTVPNQRKVAKKCRDISLSDAEKLLKSKVHEHRLTALFILIDKFKKGEKEKVYSLYLNNAKKVNNWDLVDSSAPYIVGKYLLDKDRKVLYSLAKSDNLWERRIAMLSCFAFIRNNDFSDALNIAEILVDDKHDLMHKAVGWMLREIGKLDMSVEEKFLKKYCRTMPRTMLRYAIEKFPEAKRKFYMGRV